MPQRKYSVVLPTTDLELPFWQRGMSVAGVDEAGRGALAGPVVAAAVVMPNGYKPTDGICDSKKLSQRERDRMYDVILRDAESVGVGIVDQATIDSINILQATFTAMNDAVLSLQPAPGHLLIDGNRFRSSGLPYTTIVKGDAVCLSIAAASIVAKVTRDRLLEESDERYPQYGFAVHKGYATPQHRNAIRTHGATSYHRKTFLRAVLNPQQSLFRDELSLVPA
ncbi:MAG: ribonuclease HII [Candidatus Kapabacteria bacterium]|nr:ribonuclease HII [Candidatus Kapabacteria bacterium]